MFIHSSNYCTGYTEECIQPNALDITVDTIDKIRSSTDTPVILRKDKTIHSLKDSVEPDYYGLFDLEPGEYSFESGIFCKIPDGVVGWLVSRSSLNRNGIFILSGVYDSGFNGYVGGTIYVARKLYIEKGARIAQLITAKAESVHLYNGQYQAKA